MKKITPHALLACCLLLAASVQAKIITVNNADNTNFGAGVTNLVKAISLLADGDTIRFNIPGSGVHYLLTPVNGYPLITNQSITIDGYSQPGAVPNSNPIHAANNAQLKIVLSSTNGNGIAIVFAALAASGYASFAHPGFNNDDYAILAFFRGTNNWIKGLAMQGAAEATVQGTPGPLYGIAFMADQPDLQPWPNANAGHWHVSGCWFGLNPATGQPVYLPDGSLATPRYPIGMQRNRAVDTSLVNYAQPGTVGVAAGSANPRAEFNVFLSITAANLTGLNYRICGNFFNVLPDGIHNLDVSYLPNAYSLMSSDGALIILARQGDNILVGTDGDGVNDAEEGNVFGGVSAYPFNNPAMVINYHYFDAFYGPGTGTNIVFAGNYFGMAVDGVTRFTNACTLFTSFPSTATVRFGSDFDGVSDALEANLLYNNYPFSTQFLTPGSGADVTPETIFDGQGPECFGGMNAGVRLSFRGNVTVGNDLLPYKYANGYGTRLVNFTNYSAPYMDINSANGILPSLNAAVSIYPNLVGTFAPGIAPYTNIVVDVYQADPEGWANGQLFNEMELVDPSGTTNGFAQGKKYLGSIPVANTGSFNLTLPGLADVGIGLVTVTVNYSADPAGTHNGRVLTGNFANPIYMYPGKAESVGLTHVVPDAPCWYDAVNNYVTNGPIILANQPPAVTLGNWEPFISSLGDSTFLIEFNTYADDGTFLNQNNAVAKQPAAGGPAKVGYCYYADDGTPFKGAINFSRQQGNPGKVAGDLRYGANNFITECEVSIGQIPSFQTVSRWSNNNIYAGTDRYAAEQIFTLDPVTLAQTPVAKAWEYVYGPYVGAMGPANNAPQCSRTGGRPNFLDNGNIVVMIDDKTAIASTAGEVTTFAIIQPDGTIVKGPTLAKEQDIFDNMCAVKGGFVIRVHNSLLFYNNSGSLTYSNDVNVSSGMNFGGSPDAGGRGDAIRINGDIRSHYVFLAGTSGGGGGTLGIPMGVAAWDARTGQFAGGSIVSDGNPATIKCDRAGLAADALDRVCVAYAYQADSTVFGYQVVARVAQFDGVNFNWFSHSFYPFVNHDQDPANVLGFATSNPYVAMNTRQICIAAKGTINNANNVAAGPNTPNEQTVYTVISNPAPVPAPRPTVSITRPDSSHVTLTWNVEDGLFTVQTKASPTSGTWTALTAGNVAPPVTVQIGAGPSLIRLAR